MPQIDRQSVIIEKRAKSLKIVLLKLTIRILTAFEVFGDAGIALCAMLLWSPYVIGQTIIFSSPNLSGRRLDVYHTLAHVVALVRI